MRTYDYTNTEGLGYFEISFTPDDIDALTAVYEVICSQVAAAVKAMDWAEVKRLATFGVEIADGITALEKLAKGPTLEESIKGDEE